ncbi:hypothetical protein DY218_30860 [Streptomyces triticagri]|uniref:Uncharacterized protein n=1 Tax=Streptomyces triticagri TaxID=2293568 RepID=A0A372LWQ2_9ACTN|nr:hypothetical protein [Streptomyces triticagri]RFU82820.1 hypothetical protein DY218_30860 [Streptomyces triticagri]
MPSPDPTPSQNSAPTEDATAAHEAAVRRAGEALQTYTLSAEGWRQSPSETLQRLLTDLRHWCDDTQRDFDRAVTGSRTLHSTERDTAAEELAAREPAAEPAAGGTTGRNEA